MRPLFLVFLLTGSLHHTMDAQAEIYKCNGTWTNHPCSEGSQAVFPEKVTAGNPSSEALSEKKSIVHELVMKQIDARRNFGVKVDVAHIEKFCLDPSSPVKDCLELVEAMDDKIDKRVNEAKEERRQERLDRNQAPDSNPSTVIAIVQAVATPTPLGLDLIHREDSIMITGTSAGITVSATSEEHRLGRHSGHGHGGYYRDQGHGHTDHDSHDHGHNREHERDSVVERINNPKIPMNRVRPQPTLPFPSKVNQIGQAQEKNK